jgi:hypothetical protein
VRTATAAALIVLLAFLIVQAAQRGLADLHDRMVGARFEEWEKARKPVRLTEWREALASAETAHRLAPGNPDHAEALGRLYDWAAFGKQPKSPVVLAYREQALIYFREAARERPVSGYTWANIAQAKLALGALDREFSKALELAAFLGPWEPEVQLAIADAGFAAWSALDASSRETTSGAAARALKRQAKDVFRIAQYRSRIAVLCEIAAAQQAPSTSCR